MNFTNYSILLIDYEQDSLKALQNHKSRDFDITTTTPNDINIPSLVFECHFDAVILDPVKDGIYNAKLIERMVKLLRPKNIPLYIFSSCNSQQSKLDCLNHGVADFMYKLVNVEELRLRLLNSIRIIKKANNEIKIGNLKVDYSLFKTFVKEEEVNLTLTEFKLLSYLIKNQTHFTHKNELNTFLFDSSYTSDATLKVHIKNLRQKLLSWDHKIDNKKTMGYRIFDLG